MTSNSFCSVLSRDIVRKRLQPVHLSKEEESRAVKWFNDRFENKSMLTAFLSELVERKTVQMWRPLASITEYDFSLAEKFVKEGLRLSPKRRRKDCRKLVCKSSPTNSLQPRTADVVGPHTKGKTNEKPPDQRELSPKGMNSEAPTGSAVSAGLQKGEVKAQEEEQDEAKKGESAAHGQAHAATVPRKKRPSAPTNHSNVPSPADGVRNA